ncbi:MAG: GyrI-like domain-containing protein [Sulfitobacter sp.]|nr:GyrI-like domain-containing protein [Sulfitobacter sp.]
MAQKLDLKKTLKEFYQPPVGKFVSVDMPELQFIMVDGAGDPNTVPAYRKALEALYSVSYAMKFASKNSLHLDYVVPPLEGLWWADDPADFVARNKDRWKWTIMIMVPNFVTREMFQAAKEKAVQKLGALPESLRFLGLCEGQCMQTMHIGSYDEEGP